MNNKDNIKEVDANEVYNMHLSNHIKVIDIREPYEHRDITMNGTLNIPPDEFPWAGASNATIAKFSPLRKLIRLRQRNELLSQP